MSCEQKNGERLIEIPFNPGIEKNQRERERKMERRKI